MIVAVYVDDLIVAGNSDEVERLREYFNSFFPTKSLGELKHYLGCSFTRDWENGLLKICQTAVIDKLLERYEVASTSPTPACLSVQLRAREQNEEKFEGPYKEPSGASSGLAT